jgi:hypothetical protein
VHGEAEQEDEAKIITLPPLKLKHMKNISVVQVEEEEDFRKIKIPEILLSCALGFKEPADAQSYFEAIINGLREWR